MTDEEIIAHDLQKAAYHEAGHLVALHALGGEGNIELIYHSDTTNLRKNSAYTGKVHIFRNVEGESLRIMALCGVASELLMLDPEATGDDLMFDFETEEQSETDREFAEGYTDETAEAAIDLLRQHWGAVQQIAEYKIVQETTNRSAEPDNELFEKHYRAIQKLDLYHPKTPQQRHSQ